MKTQTAPQDSQCTSHVQTLLHLMVGKAGIVSVVNSFMCVCTSRALTAKAAGNPVAASEWWKLSEQLANGALVAALSVEVKRGETPF